MIIEKRINNNVVLAADDQQQMILMGKGIGFQKYPGDHVIEAVIEKCFYSESSLTVAQMAALVMNASSTEMEVVDEIISYGQQQIASRLNPNIFFTLLDHILFSIERCRQNQLIVNPLEWEIKKFYPVEYRVGRYAVGLIRQKLAVAITDTEAAFICLHFVNGHPAHNVMELTALTERILRMVKYHLKCDYDEESWHFNRFVTHIRYYLLRQKAGNGKEVPQQYELTDLIFNRFPKEKACVDVIAAYLLQEKNWQTTAAEKMYLILHIRNLLEKHN